MPRVIVMIVVASTPVGERAIVPRAALGSLDVDVVLAYDALRVELA